MQYSTHTLPDHSPVEPPDRRLCPVCYGTGYVIPPATKDDPFPRATACPISCSLDALSKKMIDNSNLPPLWTTTLTQCKWPTRTLSSLATEINNTITQGNLQGLHVLQGPSGTGKTFLMQAAVYTAAKLGLRAYYTQMPEHMAIMRNWDDGPANKRHADLINNARVIALDEIDKHGSTDFVHEARTNLIHALYDSTQPYAQPTKLILIASNRPIEDERQHIRSRLLPATTRIEGRDIRQKNQKNQQMPNMQEEFARTSTIPY